MRFFSDKIKIKKSLFALPLAICIFMVFTGFINRQISDNNLKLTLQSSLKLNLTACRLKESKRIVLQKDSLIWSADGVTKLNKDRSIITLQGNARFKCSAFSIIADEIIINKSTAKVFAKNFTIIDHETERLTKGTFGEFSLKKN